LYLCIFLQEEQLLVMLDNEGQEMLDRDVVVVSALVNSSNSSSQPGPSNLKTEVVFQDAADAVKKMAATNTGEPVSQPSSIGGDSTRNDKKTTADSNICIIEKIPDLDERGGIIVGVDSILSSSPTKAVATALAAVFSLSGGDMLEDRDFDPITDASKGDDIGGGKSLESSAAALGAIWCDSGGKRSGKEGGSDTVSEYLDAC
jgi:hypothetical protein